MNMDEILRHIAVARPNYSSAVDATSAFIRDLLSSWGIPFSMQEFTLRPYMGFIVGLTTLILAVLLAVFIIRKKPVAALIAALAIPILLIIEQELLTPVVSWLVVKSGNNIIVHFPAPDAVRELIFTAHYDSKTDFFDHVQRARIYRWIPHAIGLGVLLPLWGLLARRYRLFDQRAARIAVISLSAALIAYWSLIALGFGGYVLPQKESPGAVDNATAVSLLLQLAQDIHTDKVNLGRSNITLVFTGGEEVGLQGAKAYVNKYIKGPPRTKRLPASLVNLDLAGQNGNLVYAAKDGVFLRYYAPDPALVTRFDRVWMQVSGRHIEKGQSITDDAVCFMAAGIPSIRLGNSGLPGMGMGGFHKPTDNLERVNWDNMRRMHLVLMKYIESYSTP